MSGRAIICVLDSVGCGGAPDAAEYGDAGANTLAHIAQACADGRAEDGRAGPLKLPHLDGLGLGAAIRLASGEETPGLGATPRGRWGAATESSRGKDTPSGHWELAGVPVAFEWYYFPPTVPAFPAHITQALIDRAALPGILGNKHASGMPIIRELGAEHIATGRPICYTSTDSVFQIAAHEEHFGLDRLMAVCRIAAELVHPLPVGRVIARPFTGETPADFRRTADRHDFALEPPEATLCDRVVSAGRAVWGIGKIEDIFAGRGVTESLKAPDDQALIGRTLEALENAPDGALIFANYVDFDTLYGHPRDVAGYARALEAFDARVPELTAALRPDDLLVFTADHGNDPTWTGTDHTRERVPVLMTGAAEPGEIGLCGFADIAASAAAHLGLPPGRHGRNLL